MNKMMKTERTYKIICSCLIVTLVVTLFAVPCFAAGDVAGAIESTWNAAKEQIQQVTNNVIFPALDMILAILFFVKVGGAYLNTRSTVNLNSPRLVSFLPVSYLLLQHLFIFGT